MIFAISGVETPIWLPPAVAFGISFFTSMGGVSGAFILLPFQISFLGYTAPSVSATNHVYNIVAIPSGVYRFIKEGRMLWPLTWAVIIGTLPGVFIGTWVRIKYLPDPKNFKLFASLVLLFLGIRMIMDILKEIYVKNNRKAVDALKGDSSVQTLTSNFLQASFRFQKETFTFSLPIVYILSFIVGIAGGIYGIGGGAIIAPFFVSILGLPVYTVAGAALMGTLITSFTGVLFFQFLAGLYPDSQISPDWYLGFLFGLGGFIGMYMGARCQKYVSSKIIKVILCVCILMVAFKYLINWFIS